MRRSLVACVFVASMAWAPSVLAGGMTVCRDHATEGTGTTVVLVETCYSPAVTRVPIGATVTFENRDPFSHDVTAYGWGFFDLEPRERAEVTFDEPGTFPFACSIHPGMTGAVVVGDGVRGPRAAPIVAAVAAGVGLGAAGRSVLRRRSSGG